MSYHVIKSIGVNEDDGKVFITGADNNVYPRTPHQWECTSLSKILVEQGREAVDLEIFKAYESGEFQCGTNKWTRALKSLRASPEYKDFDWREKYEPFEVREARRKSPAFNDLLKKALAMKLPKPLKLQDGMVIKLSTAVRFSDGTEGQVFKVCKPIGSRRRCLFLRCDNAGQSYVYGKYRLPAYCLEKAELFQG